MANNNLNRNIGSVANIIPQLRELLSDRPMRVFEALRVAEQQAQRLRQLVGNPAPRLEIEKLTNLPRINVQLAGDMEDSGSTHWKQGVWQIRLNATEPLVRQRFTLCHELKHVLDAPRLDHSYGEILKRIDGQQQIEAICDYFAACLLMPKHWVKRLWSEGVHDLNLLAGTFNVSEAAMKRRLQSIGLIDQQLRIKIDTVEGAGAVDEEDSLSAQRYIRPTGLTPQRWYRQRSLNFPARPNWLTPSLDQTEFGVQKFGQESKAISTAQLEATR